LATQKTIPSVLLQEPNIYFDMRSAWDRLAEALGITEIDWSAVQKRRQMQQYGTMDRRNKQGPMPYFKPGGMQQRAQQARMVPPGSGQQAMQQIPFGSDRPGQVNPLFAQPPRPKSPLSTAPNSPQAMDGGDEEDEGVY
jgi:hypothetical protein